jgi:phosphatidylglycerol:prolipoprotein diacylglycerol transferase
MIPYFPEPVLPLGVWKLHAFTLMLLAGIITGRTILLRRARRLSIPFDEIVPLYLTMLIAGLSGAILAQALEIRMGFTLNAVPGMESIGGLLAGLPAGIAVCFLRRCPLHRSLLLLDIIAFAVPFASCVARFGCVLAHDHRGLPSTAWYAVRFPEGPRYDLGLLEFVFLAGLSGLFLLLDRKPRPAGFFAGLAGILYGVFRLCRASLDVKGHDLAWVIVSLAGAAWLVLSGAPVAKSTLTRHGIHPHLTPSKENS